MQKRDTVTTHLPTEVSKFVNRPLTNDQHCWERSLRGLRRQRGPFLHTSPPLCRGNILSSPDPHSSPKSSSHSVGSNDLLPEVFFKLSPAVKSFSQGTQPVAQICDPLRADAAQRRGWERRQLYAHQWEWQCSAVQCIAVFLFFLKKLMLPNDLNRVRTSTLRLDLLSKNAKAHIFSERVTRKRINQPEKTVSSISPWGSFPTFSCLFL